MCFRYARRLGINDYHASSGFISRLKKRFGITSKKINGEKADCPNTDVYVRDVLHPLLSQYDACDIYNADETSFFYKCLPNRTLVFAGNKPVGAKIRKDRVTLLLITSMDGRDKLKPIVVGKALNPRCFAVWRRNPNTNPMPVDYYSNRKAWMNGDLWAQILGTWNAKLVAKDRKILLLVDNASCHTHMDLSNINLQFLPPNTTTKLQPLDQGIILSVKTHYKSNLARKYLRAIEAGITPKRIAKQLTLKPAVEIIARVWKRVPAQLIRNCFRKAYFIAKDLPGPQPLEACEHDVAMTAEEWERVMVACNTDMTFEQYAVPEEDEATYEPLTDDQIIEKFFIFSRHSRHVKCFRKYYPQFCFVSGH